MLYLYLICTVLHPLLIISNHLQDCGSLLYADLPTGYGSYIDRLASSLKGQGPTGTHSVSTASESPAMTSDVFSTTRNVDTSNQTASRTLTTTQDTRDKSTKDFKKLQASKGNSSTNPDCVAGIQRFLALCINTIGDYKVCSEIPMLKITSDAQLFLEMKKRYLAKRGSWSHMNIFVKPMTVEFIQVYIPYQVPVAGLD